MAAELPLLIAENRSQVGAAGAGTLDEDVFGPAGGGLDEDVFGRAGEGPTPLPLVEIRPSLSAGQRAGRIATEMGGQMIGEAIGSKGGVPGIMLGGGAGAAAGSLVAESFAPSEDPAHEALMSGMFGAIPLGPLFRWAFSPKVLSEEGQALIDIARKQDVAIPPALASNSRGMQLAQGIARGTAFGGSKVDDAVQAFGRALGEEGEEASLRAMGLSQVERDVFRELNDPTNARTYDPQRASKMLQYGAGYALQGKIALESVFRAADNMGLKVKTDTIKLYVEGLQRVAEKRGQELPEGMKGIFRAIESMDDTVALRDFHKLRSELLAAGRFESGATPRAMVDEAKAMAADIADVITKQGERAVAPARLSEAWLGASALWRQHKQGELVKEITDLGLKEVGGGDVRAASQRVISELNKEWVKKTLTAEQQLNLRRYANLLGTYQHGAGTNLYQFATRGAQIAQAAGIVGGFVAGGATESMGGPQGNLQAAAAVALPVFLAPEVMARIFSDPGMSRVFLQGFKSKTPVAAIGAVGVLLTRLADEGLAPKEVLDEFNEVRGGGQAMRGRIQFPAGTRPENYR